MADEIKTRKIVSQAEGEIVNFHLMGTVFVSAFAATTGKGMACHLSDRDLTDASLPDFLRPLTDNQKDVEIKIVGSEKLCQSLEKIVRGLGLKNIKITIREDKPRLLFYPSSGRVRVEKKEGADPVKTRVMIVDDSKTIRDLLERIFSHDPQIEVVGTTGKPLEVLGLMAELKPDVITMDIHMPDMDGVTLLKEVMQKNPTPVVMITSATIEDGPAVLQALEIGAVDYIHKPDFKELDDAIPIIIEKVKTAASANIAKHAAPTKVSSPIAQKLDQNVMVAIGSSTGGTEALRILLTQLPKEIPPIVIVQHIPPVFSLAFANRMAKDCRCEVKEAEHGDEVRPGRVLIAPGGKQMEIKASGSTYKIVIHDGPPVNRFKPSVDVLFDSVRQQCKNRMIGIILTGMGSDGARGLLRMRQAGAHTIAQSEKTCVVYGMPREAVKMGAAIDVVDLQNISGHLIKLLASKSAVA